jgi:hypothetical protein
VRIDAVPVLAAVPDRASAVNAVTPEQEAFVALSFLAGHPDDGECEDADNDDDGSDIVDAATGTEGSQFWTDAEPSRWWRRRRPSTGALLQAGALGAVTLAAVVHFL